MSLTTYQTYVFSTFIITLIKVSILFNETYCQFKNTNSIVRIIILVGIQN